ncbi:MAG TPA: hypothetical protein VHB77_11845 [Planctomycetaceae bacterium]|nr:hypothetical protein [Planctomycetaceae bacterium]
MNQPRPTLHPLTEQAIARIQTWNSAEVPEMCRAVAELCRETLNAGGLPTDSPDWQRMREAFEIQAGDSIADSLKRWDHWVRYAQVDLSDRAASVKLGVVTWSVKLLLKQLGLLPASEPYSSLEEWKQQLCHLLATTLRHAN